MKGFWKRSVSALLAAVLFFAVLAAGAAPAAEAAGTSESVLIAFPRSGDAHEVFSEEAWGHPALTLMNGWKAGGTDSWLVHAQGSWDGQVCYCIEPGVARNFGDMYEGFGEDFWDNWPSGYNSTIVPDTIKLLLGRIMQYGYQGNVSEYWKSQNSADADCLEKIMATQVLVWETVVGERDEAFRHVSPGGADPCRSFISPGNPLYGRFCAFYDSIESAVQNHTEVPGFFSRTPAGAQTAELTWDGSAYSASLTDEAGVLADFTFSTEAPGVTFSVSGNTLTVSSRTAPAEPVLISAERTLRRSGVLVWSDGRVSTSEGAQDVATYSAQVSDPIRGFLRLEVSAGSVRIVKTSEDGNVSGISFTVTGNGETRTAVTGGDGTVLVEGLRPGSYTVTEASSGVYVPQPSRTVTVESGKTAEVRFQNELMRGSLRVTKTAEDGAVAGASFRLTGVSDSGERVDLTAVTGEDGTALFENVPVGSGYVLEEVGTPVRYVAPEAIGCDIRWDEVTEKTVKNVLKKFRVTLGKTDGETGIPGGDASLAGAVYGLYRGEELEASYATDESGFFTTDWFPCGEDWTVREISPSEGYLLDPEVHPVGAEPGNFTLERNEISLSVTEEIIRGSISIIKYCGSGATGQDEPEEGAEFEVYLKSAGSFENAPEDARAYLLCDENGYARTGLLPYGVYTVHQTAGREGRERMEDLDVFLSEEGQTVRLLINNAVFQSYLRIVKRDRETGLAVPVAGAGFRIYDPQGEPVRMLVAYPEPQEVEVFYTTAEGTLVTPRALPYGRGYSLVEATAPRGYVLDPEPVFFDITEESSGREGPVTVTVAEKTDVPQKGVIRIFKTGEVFASAERDGELWIPVYEERGLPGAVYEIRAAEDIVTPEGTVRLRAGEVADTVVTGEDGTGVSRELYLGRYEIRETEAPYGMVLNTEVRTAELTWAGQEIAVTETSLSIRNERQTAGISLQKVLETDVVFGTGENGEVTSAVFGLYAASDMTALDGTVIPAGGLLALAACHEDGSAEFSCDVPAGTEMTVREISADGHYLLSEETWSVVFTWAGGGTPRAEIRVAGGLPIENELKRGSVRGVKTDGNGGTLPGALFGLFRAGETDFTEETALLTAESDENGLFFFRDLVCGDWLVREIRAPEGYVLTEEAIPVSVREDGDLIEIGFEDLRVTGSVTLTKVDPEYPENRLTGAVFEIFADLDGDGAFREDRDALLGLMEETEPGVYRRDGLFYGGYFVRERTAPAGFRKDDGAYFFEIRENGATVTVENEAGVGFLNAPLTGAVRIEKTSEDGVLAGFTFLVEGTDLWGNSFSGEYVTDASGKILVEGLRIGTYTVREAESEASARYVLPPEVTLNVLEGKTTVARFENRLRPEIPEAPQTGDVSRIRLWAAAAALSLGLLGVVALTSLRKKRKEKKEQK